MNSGCESDSLIMIDEDMYSARLAKSDRNNMRILEINGQKYIVGFFWELHVLFQINEKEFLISYKQNDGTNKIEHLEYNEKCSILSSKYELVYNDSNNNFLISKDVIIVRDNDMTTIYNYKNGNVLMFDNLHVVGTRKVNGNTYLVANISVGNMEKLVMYIDVASLEFSEFYSTLQDRYIKVIEDREMDFRNRLGITLEKQVYKYAEYIEEYEEELKSRNMIAICKRLEKKK